MGRDLAGGSTCRATDDGLEAGDGLAAGEGLATRALGAVEQALSRTTAASAQSRRTHMLNQRMATPLRHGQRPPLRSSLSTAEAISSRDRSYSP